MTEKDKIPELDLSKTKIDKTLGYEYVYDPNHPMANKSGKVYVHRYKAAKRGDNVEGKHVHHKDEDKANNNNVNLETLTIRDHAKEHYSNLIPYVNSRKIERIEYACKKCNTIFTALPSENRIYCSMQCLYESRCKTHVHVCVSCGISFESKDKNRKACSRLCGNRYAASFRKSS